MIGFAEMRDVYDLYLVAVDKGLEREFGKFSVDGSQDFSIKNIWNGYRGVN